MNAIAPAPKIKRHRSKQPWPLPMRPTHGPMIQQGYKTTTLRRDAFEDGHYKTQYGQHLQLTLDSSGPINWKALTDAEKLALARTEGYSSVDRFIKGTQGIPGITEFLSGAVPYWRHWIRPYTTAITAPAPEGTGTATGNAAGGSLATNSESGVGRMDTPGPDDSAGEGRVG